MQNIFEFKKFVKPNAKVVATIEARMGSSRLPGKVLKPFYKSTVLGFMIDRLKYSILIDEIVVATSSEIRDEEISNIARVLEYYVTKGEDDVLKRVYSAAKTNGATVVVELTGDCPLIDPIIVDQMIAGFFANQVDYHTNTVKRSYPDGMDVQVMSIEALEKAFHCSSDPYDREHVTLHLQQSRRLDFPPNIT